MGCDSTATLNLIINNDVYYSLDTTVCESFEFGGISFNSSGGPFEHAFDAANGCDSIVTLNLTIINSSSSGKQTLLYVTRSIGMGKTILKVASTLISRKMKQAVIP